MSVWPQCSPQDLAMSFNDTSLPSSFQMVASDEDLPPKLIPDLNNFSSTVLSSNAPQGPPVIDYLWWKVFLIIWDSVGIVVNTFGIDMLWHGVEVNHVVYNIILQDVCLAMGSALISTLTTFFFWWDDLSWFRIHSFLCFLPYVFHNWAWASVASLRCLNITNNDQWLELDQDTVRRRTSWMTWFATLGNIFAIAPLAFSLTSYITFTRAYNIVTILVFSIIGITFIIAFIYYIRIYNHAVKEAAEFNAAIAAAAEAAANNPPGSAASMANSNPAMNIFDDSDDDDLLDPTESPSAKQESAAINALKTMIIFALADIFSAVILIMYPEDPWKYALLSTMLTVLRHPGISIMCIFNFGPIRNTLALYMENLPDHFNDFIGPITDWFAGLRIFSRSLSDDQQTNIVEEASNNDLERANSPANNIRNQSILGKRDSAVSPESSNNSMDELPAVQC